MKLNKLTLALSLALFALPMAVMAQEAATTDEQSAEQAAEAADAQQAPEAAQEAEMQEHAMEAQEPAEEAPADEAAGEEAESNLSWNLSLTSDYVFRGVTQTDRDPALQGGADYKFGSSGWYIGVWGSNVDFVDPIGPDIEVDTYVGYNTDLNDSWNFDAGLYRYNYIGENDGYGNIDYNELIGKLTYKEWLTFTLAYSDDYVNSGDSEIYYNVAGSWDIGHGFSLNAGVGYTDIDNTDGLTDWNIGVSRSFGPIEAALNYYDTDADGPRLSDAVVLSLSIGG